MEVASVVGVAVDALLTGVASGVAVAGPVSTGEAIGDTLGSAVAGGISSVATADGLGDDSSDSPPQAARSGMSRVNNSNICVRRRTVGT